jgi:hypothetical protein
MKNQTWIEPPPPQKGMGCFAKGCLILIAFVVLLVIAFVGGTYLAVRYLRADYFPKTRATLPSAVPTQQVQQDARARWDAFESAARAHQPARIELTADDMNALIASEPELRGKADVMLDGNVGRLRVSMPLDGFRWLRGHYLNAECTVQSGPAGDPDAARITAITVNGRPVSDDVLRWQYGSWSVRGYIETWSRDKNLERFEINDGRVILQTKGEITP